MVTSPDPTIQQSKEHTTNEKRQVTFHSPNLFPMGGLSQIFSDTIGPRMDNFFNNSSQQGSFSAARLNDLDSTSSVTSDTDSTLTVSSHSTLPDGQHVSRRTGKLLDTYTNEKATYKKSKIEIIHL